MSHVAKYTDMVQRIGPYVKDWTRELRAQLEQYSLDNPPEETVLAKRPAPAPKRNGDGPVRKKSKLIESGGIDSEAFRIAVEKDTLGKFTVPDLKGFLTSVGQSTGGKKQELIERVQEYYDTKRST